MKVIYDDYCAGILALALEEKRWLKERLNVFGTSAELKSLTSRTFTLRKNCVQHKQSQENN